MADQFTFSSTYLPQTPLDQSSDMLLSQQLAESAEYAGGTFARAGSMPVASRAQAPVQDGAIAASSTATHHQRTSSDVAAQDNVSPSRPRSGSASQASQSPLKRSEAPEAAAVNAWSSRPTTATGARQSIDASKRSNSVAVSISIDSCHVVLQTTQQASPAVTGGFMLSQLDNLVMFSFGSMSSQSSHCHCARQHPLPKCCHQQCMGLGGVRIPRSRHFGRPLGHSSAERSRCVFLVVMALRHNLINIISPAVSSHQHCDWAVVTDTGHARLERVLGHHIGAAVRGTAERWTNVVWPLISGHKRWLLSHTLRRRCHFAKLKQTRRASVCAAGCLFSNATRAWHDSFYVTGPHAGRRGCRAHHSPVQRIR